jgi:hypothetical protein
VSIHTRGLVPHLSGPWIAAVARRALGSPLVAASARISAGRQVERLGLPVRAHRMGNLERAECAVLQADRNLGAAAPPSHQGSGGPVGSGGRQPS